jgi:outer membrane biosynthesis protein TonB
MPSLNVDLMLPRGGRMEGNEFPDNLKSSDLVSQLVKELNLPRETPSGQPIFYWLEIANQGKKISKDETLGDAGVNHGDVLRLLSSHKFQVYSWSGATKPGNVVAGELITESLHDKPTHIAPLFDAAAGGHPLIPIQPPAPSPRSGRHYRTAMLAVMMAASALVWLLPSKATDASTQTAETLAISAEPKSNPTVAPTPAAPSFTPEPQATPPSEPAVVEPAPAPVKPAPVNRNSQSRRNRPPQKIALAPKPAPVAAASPQPEKKKCGFWGKVFAGCQEKKKEDKKKDVANTGKDQPSQQTKGVGGAIKSSAINHGRSAIDGAIGSQTRRIFGR